MSYGARFGRAAWWGLLVFALLDLASIFVSLGAFVLLVGLLVPSVCRWLVRRVEVLR